MITQEQLAEAILRL